MIINSRLMLLNKISTFVAFAFLTVALGQTDTTDIQEDSLNKVVADSSTLKADGSLIKIDNAEKKSQIESFAKGPYIEKMLFELSATDHFSASGAFLLNTNIPDFGNVGDTAYEVVVKAFFSAPKAVMWVNQELTKVHFISLPEIKRNADIPALEHLKEENNGL